jgi:hypothetical protein
MDIRRRIDEQAERSHEQALDSFVARKAEIDRLLARLQDLSDEHFGVGPDDVTWGEVGSLDFVAGKLREAVVHLCGEDLPADA